MIEPLEGANGISLKSAEAHLASAMEARDKITQEYLATFRWLLASLLAVNSGASFAILSSISIVYQGKILAGSLFFFGIVSCLFLALWTQRTLQVMMTPVSKTVNLWLEAAQHGQVDFEQRELINAELKKAELPLRLSAIAGWISAISFVLGVLVMGYFLK